MWLSALLLAKEFQQNQQKVLRKAVKHQSVIQKDYDGLRRKM